MGVVNSAFLIITNPWHKLLRKESDLFWLLLLEDPCIRLGSCAIAVASVDGVLVGRILTKCKALSGEKKHLPKALLLQPPVWDPGGSNLPI